MQLLAQDPQLVDGGGTVDVGGDEERLLPFLEILVGELAGGRRLAGALQPVTLSFPFFVSTFVSTTSPTAFSRTRATKRFTTSKATSASSSETRMSRSASSTTSVVISVRPLSLLRAALNPFATVSSMPSPK